MLGDTLIVHVIECNEGGCVQGTPYVAPALSRA